MSAGFAFPQLAPGTDDSGPAVPRGGARGSAWMALGALLVAVVVAPIGVDLGSGGFGRLVDGHVEVAEEGGWRPLEAPGTVPAGASLRVGEQSARVEVDGGLLTLAEGTEVVADRAGPQVQQGSVLVEAEEPLAVRVGATTADGDGTWRVDVGAASRVATYAGRLRVADEQGARELAPYRQVGVRDGALEPGLRPLRYQDDDPWDDWVLADALAVDRLVERLEASLERSYGDQPREVDFYTAFVVVDDAGLAPDLAELAVTVEDEALGPPADLLTAVAAIDALHVETDVEVEQTRERVVTLRRAGASWGLVLVEHGLGASALRQAADRALEQVETAPPPGSPAAEPEPEPANDGAPATLVEQEPSGSVTAEPDPADPAPTDPTPTEPAPEAPAEDDDPQEEGAEDPPGDGALEPIGDAVQDTGGAVGELLESAGELAGGVVEETTGNADELLDDTTDTVDDVLDGAGSLLGEG